MAIFKTNIEVDGVEDVPVIVHYTAHKASRGATDGPGGPPLEPSEPAWIEIDYVADESDRILSVPNWQESRLRDEIAESLDERN